MIKNAITETRCQCIAAEIKQYMRKPTAPYTHGMPLSAPYSNPQPNPSRLNPSKIKYKASQGVSYGIDRKWADVGKPMSGIAAERMHIP